MVLTTPSGFSDYTSDYTFSLLIVAYCYLSSSISSSIFPRCSQDSSFPCTFRPPRSPPPWVLPVISLFFALSAPHHPLTTPFFLLSLVGAYLRLLVSVFRIIRCSQV